MPTGGDAIAKSSKQPKLSSHDWAIRAAERNAQAERDAKWLADNPDTDAFIHGHSHAPAYPIGVVHRHTLANGVFHEHSHRKPFVHAPGNFHIPTVNHASSD